MIDTVFQLRQAVEELGSTDCESIHDGLLAQPVNATTSLAYVLAGSALILKDMRDSPERRSRSLYGVILVAIGFGSVAFHGPQIRGSEYAHDLPITAALLFITLHNLERLDRVHNGSQVFLISLVPTGLLGMLPTLNRAVTGMLAVAAVTTEIGVHRSRPEQRARYRRRAGAMVCLLVAAAISFAAGRTGSPLCRPDSLFQLHGLWHLFSAAAFALWGFSSFDDVPERESLTRGGSS